MKRKNHQTKTTQGQRNGPKGKCANTQPSGMTTKRKVTLISCVAGLALLGLVLMMGMLKGWDLGSWFQPRENNLYYRKDYSVRDGKARRKQDVVVATMGDRELTNAMLQVYYWRQVYDFRDSYSDSISYLGLDLTADLSEQTYLDGTSSWQQYFLKSALDTWKTNLIFAELAAQNGFELPADYQELLDNLDERLLQTANNSGYATVEDMVKGELGAGCTVEAYKQYLQVYYTSYLYFRELYEALEPAEEDILSYYEENEESYTSSGITQDDSIYVDFRHIMLYPENGTLSTSGTPSYSEEDWEHCREQAERLLAQWKNGERTEESFAELARTYSDDTTTKDNGGLYSGVATGDLMDEIEAWCFDTARQAGDCQLIKTAYGYHLVYFVESEAVWHAEVRSDLVQQMAKELVEECIAGYTMTVDYKKIVLSKVKVDE